MQVTEVEAAQLGGNAATDFSIWGMFASADIIVQAVMLLLVFSSLWSWSIIFNTSSRVKTASKNADAFETGQSLTPA